MFVIYNSISRSVDAGEEAEGWPSYDAALTACTKDADAPAYHGKRGLVHGRAACARAVASDIAAQEQADAYSARRAALIASIKAAPVAAPVATPSADQRRTNMLVACKAALIAEQAKGKRADQSEIARLMGNIQKLEV